MLYPAELRGQPGPFYRRPGRGATVEALARRGIQTDHVTKGPAKGHLRRDRAVLAASERARPGRRRRAQADGSLTRTQRRSDGPPDRPARFAKREVEMIVSDILKTKGKNVVTVAPDTPVGTAVATLAEKRIGCIVVTTDGGALAGILSERDVVRVLAQQGGDVLDEPVSALMTAKVVTCSPSQTIADVMEMMTQGRFRHVPVLEEGRLAGMVSIGDVVKFRLEETEEEVRQLSAYVAGG